MANEPSELVKLVMQKANLPQAQAESAVNTVVGFLKEKLPAPLGAQIDGLLANAGALGGVGDLTKNLGGLGGMLGGLGKDK